MSAVGELEDARGEMTDLYDSIVDFWVDMRRLHQGDNVERDITDNTAFKALHAARTIAAGIDNALDELRSAVAEDVGDEANSAH